MKPVYTTQMDAARQGIITPVIEAAAQNESMSPQALMALIAEGKAVIPANRLHRCIAPNAIGSMLRTKINVNLGVSRDCKDYDIEMKKVLSAVSMGAEAIIDLSNHENMRCLNNSCSLFISISIRLPLSEGACL